MDAEAPSYPGRCQCGELRYRFSGEPMSCYACHCQGCQRGSGSPYSVSLLVPRSAIEVESGELSESSYTLPTGERTWSGCAKCGASLWYSSPAFPEIAAIKPGTLDSPEPFQPVAHLWTKHTQPHVRFAEGVTRFEEQPATLEALLELWAKR